MKKLTLLDSNLVHRLSVVWRMRLVIVIVVIAGLCGYLILTINQAVTVSADPAAVSANRGPRIDPALAQQLEQLQDNSVSVKALFNDARDNPFSN